MSGGGGGGGPAFNPHAVGAIASISPQGGGVGILGILRDSTGFGIGTSQGLMAKQIVQGGIAGIAGQPKPGMLSKLGLDRDSILRDLGRACSNENLAAIQQMNAGNIPHFEPGTNVSPSAAPQVASAQPYVGEGIG